MAKRVWNLDLEDGTHTVALDHGFYSGKRAIHVDGQLVHRSYKHLDRGSVHAFEIGTHNCVVRIYVYGVGLTCAYDLIVDGSSVETGQEYEVTIEDGKLQVRARPLPLRPERILAWLFMAVCLGALLTALFVRKSDALTYVVQAGLALLGIAIIDRLGYDVSQGVRGLLFKSTGIMALCWLAVLAMPSLSNIQSPAMPQRNPGWATYQNQVEGFAIDLPPAWETVDADLLDWDAGVEVFKEQNPKVSSAFVNALRSLKPGLRLYAFDPTVEDPRLALPISITIVRMPLRAESLDAFVRGNVESLNATEEVTKPVLRRRVELTAGAAEELRYELNMNSETGDLVPLTITQILLRRGSQVFMITLSVISEQAVEYAIDFQRIARSFRFIN